MSDYCAMSMAVLRVAIKTFEEQPDGLDAACVREYATVAGKVYVDARFMKGADLEPVRERSCTREKFVTRFDFKRYEQSPSQGILFLSVKSETPAGREFSLTVEEASWTTRAPGVLAMPPCYPAFGILNRSSAVEGGWTARVAPAPRGPDDL